MFLFRKGSFGKLTINNKMGYVVVNSVYKWKLVLRASHKNDEDYVNAFSQP